MSVNWHWLSYQQLTKEQLHQMMRVRQAVFVVEQNCPYQDADELDEVALHLLGYRDDGSQSLLAYLRLLPPGTCYPDVALGRVLTTQAARGQQVGRAMMTEALHYVADHYPGETITISAQCYLDEFYRSFGFQTIGQPYEEDGIPHQKMRR